MRRSSGVGLLLGAVLMSGCYHATVETGRTASGQVVEKEWAHGFVYGLVPPSTIDVAQECPNGIASVETQLSFLNQVASALTFGIYTPMSIKVECAAAATAANGTMMRVQPGATSAEAHEAVVRAAKVSADREEPVYLQFMAE